MNEELLDAFRRRIIHSQLEDGTRVCIRSIVPADEPLMREGIEQLSVESRYLRFFSGQPMPPDRVISRLVDADGSRHIAWGAILTDNDLHPAIGAVHAVRPGDDTLSAELAQSAESRTAHDGAVGYQPWRSDVRRPGSQ
jgi:hypothetical protein